MNISGRIRVLRFPASIPVSHLVTFLGDGESGAAPHRQCWGLRALDAILRGLAVHKDELAAVHADLEKDGEAVIHRTLSEKLLERCGLRQEGPHRGAPGSAPHRAQSQHRFPR